MSLTNISEVCIVLLIVFALGTNEVADRRFIVLAAVLLAAAIGCAIADRLLV